MKKKLSWETWWNKLVKIFSSQYSYKIVQDIPNNIEPVIIYIIKDGMVADTLVFKCPCGCGNVIHLNLLNDTSPCWRYKIQKKKISISPSVRALKGCKSHFWITNGNVDWSSYK